MDDLKSQAVAAVDELAPRLIEVSRRIHAHPELAFTEHVAADLLCSELERDGLSPRRAAFGLETSFRCEIGDSGPRVAILSEYDALPELGHACGHNLIAAMGLGAALALARVSGLPGRIRYLGAPAEESGGGKALLLSAGAFAEVDAAMMVHPASADLQEMPTLAVTGVRAVFSGVAAHAASAAESGVNALDACVAGYQNLAELRWTLPVSEKVHGIITDGGAAANVVPERAEAVYILRAVDASALHQLVAKVSGCLEDGARSAGASVSLHWWEHQYRELCSNPPLSAAYRANAESLGRQFVELEDVPPQVRGSTDMGNVSHQIPSIHPTIGIGSGSVPPHSAGFAEIAVSAQAEQALLDGAKSMALTSIDFLSSPDLRHAAATAYGHRAVDSQRQES